MTRTSFTMFTLVVSMDNLWIVVDTRNCCESKGYDATIVNSFTMVGQTYGVTDKQLAIVGITCNDMKCHWERK